jgi:ABC-type transport system involved in multi-copper enzyme maturation permease subunit
MSLSGLGILSSIKLVASYTLQRIAWSRRSVFLLLLLMLPTLLVIVIRSNAPIGAIQDFRSSVLPSMELSIIQLLCAFLATGLIRDGIEDHTINFLLTRPLGRVRVTFGLYVGFLVMAVPSAVFAVAAAYAASVVGPIGDVPLFSDPAFWNLLTVVAIAVTFYGALYMLFGMIFKYPAIVGIGYLVLFEGFLGTLPGPPRRIVPSAWLERLLDPAFQTRATITSRNVLPDEQNGALMLIVAYVLILFLLRRGARSLDFINAQKDGS